MRLTNREREEGDARSAGSGPMSQGPGPSQVPVAGRTGTGRAAWAREEAEYRARSAT